MIPMAAPDRASHSVWRRDSFSPLSFPVSFIKRSRKRLPSIPLEKARKADETGRYRLKTPMVPKMSMERTNMARARGSLFLVSDTVLSLPCEDIPDHPSGRI